MTTPSAIQFLADFRAIRDQYASLLDDGVSGYLLGWTNGLYITLSDHTHCLNDVIRATVFAVPNCGRTFTNGNGENAVFVARDQAILQAVATANDLIATLQGVEV